MADGSANKRAKDQAMAAYMAARPNQFPDSVRKPHDGCGAADRKLAMQVSAAGHRTGNWDRGMIGGILAARLGFVSEHIPAELLPSISKAA